LRRLCTGISWFKVGFYVGGFNRGDIVLRALFITDASSRHESAIHSLSESPFTKFIVQFKTVFPKTEVALTERINCEFLLLFKNKIERLS